MPLVFLSDVDWLRLKTAITSGQSPEILAQRNFLQRNLIMLKWASKNPAPFLPPTLDPDRLRFAIIAFARVFPKEFLLELVAAAVGQSAESIATLLGKEGLEIETLGTSERAFVHQDSESIASRIQERKLANEQLREDFAKAKQVRMPRDRALAYNQLVTRLQYPFVTQPKCWEAMKRYEPYVSAVSLSASRLSVSQPLPFVIGKAKIGATISEAREKQIEGLHARLLVKGLKIPNEIIGRNQLLKVTGDNEISDLLELQIPSDRIPQDALGRGEHHRLTFDERRFYEAYVSQYFGRAPWSVIQFESGIGFDAWVDILATVSMTPSLWEIAWRSSLEHLLYSFQEISLHPLDIMYMEALITLYGWSVADIVNSRYFRNVLRTPQDVERNRGQGKLPFPRFYEPGAFVLPHRRAITDEGVALATSFMKERLGWLDSGALSELWNVTPRLVDDIRNDLGISYEEQEKARYQKLQLHPPELPGAIWPTKFILLGQLMALQGATLDDIAATPSLTNARNELRGQLSLPLPFGRKTIWDKFQRVAEVRTTLLKILLTEFPYCGARIHLRAFAHDPIHHFAKRFSVDGLVWDEKVLDLLINT